jgi:hypothetical protein
MRAVDLSSAGKVYVLNGAICRNALVLYGPVAKQAKHPWNQPCSAQRSDDIPAPLSSLLVELTSTPDIRRDTLKRFLCRYQNDIGVNQILSWPTAIRSVDNAYFRGG